MSKILDLTKSKKFEVTCASFHAVDHIFKVDLPRNLKGHKPAIQAMSLLANGQLQYGYDVYMNDQPTEDSDSSQPIHEQEALSKEETEPEEESGTVSQETSVPEEAAKE